MKLLKEHKENLKNELVGKEISALTLLKLLSTGRETDADEFSRILKARSTQNIKLQLVDLLGAIQTSESHETFKQEFNFDNDEDFEYIERYLQSLAVGTRPHEAVITDLLESASKNIENEKLRDSLIQTLASMALRFTRLPGKTYTSEVVVKVTKFLLESLAACEKSKCTVVLLRSLQNLRAPDTVKHLLTFATEHPYDISVAAMKALRVFPVFLWTKEIKSKFENIFHQRYKKFDSSARTLALDILLEMNPTRQELENLLDFLKSNDKAYEVKQYLIQKLRMIAEKCVKFNGVLLDILKKDPQLNNWHVFGGQRGLSTALARRFSQQPSFNGSLLSVQEMSNGVLKRGIVDLTIENGEEKSSLFTVSFKIACNITLK